MKRLFSIYRRFLLIVVVALWSQLTFAQTTLLKKLPAVADFEVYYDGNFDQEYTDGFHHILVAADFCKMVFDAMGNTTMDELFVYFNYYDFLGYPGYYYEMIVHFQATEDKQSYEQVGEFEEANMANYKIDCQGQHKCLYFTGTCRSAYPGALSDNTEGVFYLQGGENDKADIYLHNFNVKVQNKDLTDKTLNIDDIFSSFIRGSMASVFAVGSTSIRTDRPFVANFHICGENTLTGGNLSQMSAPEGDEILTVLADILTVINSPIAIRPMAETKDDYQKIVTSLLFDDEVLIEGVPTKVNGKLNLPLEGSHSTPSIDLGNANGYCEFNGGQYRFATPASNSMFYVCSMAICYKQFSMMGFDYFGIGSSVGTSTIGGSDNKVRVTLNNGTFSTYSAENYQEVDVVARGWYRDYTDLRLPFESRINGGSFNNCNVYRCDASGEKGMPPVKTNADYTNTSLCRIPFRVQAPASTGNGCLTVEQLPALENDEDYYGTTSLTPILEEDGEHYIYLYLPRNCENIKGKEYIHNWVTVIPKMGASGLLTMGGNVWAHKFASDSITECKNSYLFYARLNEQTKKYASVNIGMKVTVDQAIRYGGGPEFSSVTNPDTYRIEHGLYTMLSFKTNRWYSLSMPYDVANIYVIETTGTQKGKHPTIGPSETSLQFLQRQGQADGNLASTIITSLCPDIFSGKGSGVAMNLMDIIDKQLPDSATVYPLVAYNPALEGHGSKDAHYYLYEQVPDGENQGAPYWEFSEDVNEYSKKWQCVTPTPFAKGTYTNQNGIPVDAGTIQMQKGKVYSLFLPDSESSRYWDGKYLIFEGYGPQIIDGVETHDEQYFLPDYVDAWDDIYNWDVPENMGTGSEKCIMQGNSTFANFVIPDEQPVFMYDVVGNNPIYRKVDNSTLSDATKKALLPCDVMMVLNNANTARFETITRNGNTATTQSSEAPQVIADNDLPKVGDISLVAMAQNGITIRSYAAQQVNIYTLDGRLLYSDTLSDGSVVRVPAASGVYLVQGQEQTYKLIVP